MRSVAAVLLAEDEEHDVFFMRRAFSKAEIEDPLVVVTNGQEVMDYLKGQGPYADRDRYPEPKLLLLDLKMPLVDGFEVLQWLRQEPYWRDTLPVLVFSSSDQEVDKRKAFELGAHEYLVKPSSFDELVRLVEDLNRRWLEPSRLKVPASRQH